jgi:class 3 adenylate cyclase
MMDDKGSTLICLWGLLPLSHEDDAARAILSAFNMKKELNKIDGTYCNIGISSGECFSGVIGTSGSRKEYSVLGDVVNLAARIMGSIKGQKLKNEVRCDLNTRMLAANFFDFNYCAHNEFKGKSISIPTYEPIDPDIKLKSISEMSEVHPY